MAALQFVYFEGQPVAVVGGNGVAVSDQVSAEDVATVHGMCVYALEVFAGERPGPYRDEDALKYARMLLLPRCQPASRAGLRRGCMGRR